MARRKMMLSAEEHARVAAAIGVAERQTSGEIYCVLARDSDSYFYPACLILAAAVLVLGPFVALVLHTWWIAASPVLFASAQLAAFACAVLLVALLPGLRAALVPRGLKYRRAHQNAQKQFLAHNIHVTQNRTGVLIFVSLAERYVEVVADHEIDARVDQAVWNETVALLLAHAQREALADGFAEAVSRVGAVLGEHFPARARDRNEIEDRLTEI